MDYFESYLLVALCAAAISFTVTSTSMFKWLRELVSPIHSKIEELIHCPWCFGHYVVLTIMLLSRTLKYYPVFGNVIMNFIFTWFVIVSIMGLVLFILLRAFAPVAAAMARREMDKLNND